MIRNQGKDLNVARINGYECAVETWERDVPEIRARQAKILDISVGQCVDDLVQNLEMEALEKAEISATLVM
jgi:hypothetical protein